MEENFAKSRAYLRYFMFFTNASFLASVIIPYYQDKGMTIAECLLTQTMFSIGMVIFEIPSGYLSDRFSRKNILTIGAVILTLGHFGILLSYGFWQVTASEIIVSMGRSFISGTSSAILYDTLLSEGRADAYQEEEGKMKSHMVYALAFAGFLGGFLYYINADLPQFATSIAGILAFYFSLKIIEPTIEKEISNTSPIKEMVDFTKYALRGHKQIPFLIFYSAVISGGTVLAFWLSQPYWEEIGIPVWLFGVLFLLTQTARGVSLSKAHFVIGKFNNKLIVIILLCCLSVSFILQGIINHPIGVIITILPPIIFGIEHIMILKLINEKVESRMRATVISIESLAWRVIFLISAVIIGEAIEKYSLSQAFLICGFLWFIVGIPAVYILLKKKIV